MVPSSETLTSGMRPSGIVTTSGDELAEASLPGESTPCKISAPTTSAEGTAQELVAGDFEMLGGEEMSGAATEEEGAGASDQDLVEDDFDMLAGEPRAADDLGVLTEEPGEGAGVPHQ